MVMLMSVLMRIMIVLVVMMVIMLMVVAARHDDIPDGHVHVHRACFDDVPW